MADAGRDGVLVVEAVKLAPLVTQVLGRIEAPGARIEGKPAANSTRWIVNVASVSGDVVELFLLDYRSGRRISPDLMSFNVQPLNEACYDAKIVPHEGVGSLVISTGDVRHEGVIWVHYRVQIDVMHSATR